MHDLRAAGARADGVLVAADAALRSLLMSQLADNCVVEVVVEVPAPVPSRTAGGAAGRRRVGVVDNDLPVGAPGRDRSVPHC